MPTGEIKVLKYSDGTTVTAPSTVTGEKWEYDDSSTWDGAETTKTYTIDGSGSGTGAISDARKAKFWMLDASNNYEDVGGKWEALSATQVKVTFSIAPASGTYRIIGMY